MKSGNYDMREGEGNDMEYKDFCQAAGVRVGYTADTITVSEIGERAKAVFDNDGNMISSTFPKSSVGYARRQFERNYPLIEKVRVIDREYGNG